MTPAATIEEILLQEIDLSIQAHFPDHYCLYHRNPNACISGPVIYYNHCSWNLHHGNCLYRDKHIKIMVDDGCVVLTTDVLPTKSLVKVSARLDLGDPEFSASMVIEAINEHYRGAGQRQPAVPDLVRGRRRT